MNHFLHRLDFEGGRRLEIVDWDIVQLRKEVSHSINQIEQAMIGLLADLEIKFEKLELKVVKLEGSTATGSSPLSWRNWKMIQSLSDFFWSL